MPRFSARDGRALPASSSPVLTARKGRLSETAKHTFTAFGVSIRTDGRFRFATIASSRCYFDAGSVTCQHYYRYGSEGMLTSGISP